jgi:hypothetical protein
MQLPENTPEKGVEREDNFTHSSSQKISMRERERERSFTGAAVEKEGSSREDLLLMAEGSKATDCRSHEVQQRQVLCFSLCAGNSVAHRRNCKAYYSLSLSLSLCISL